MPVISSLSSNNYNVYLDDMLNKINVIVGELNGRLDNLVLGTQSIANTVTIWTSNNDGTGSGLDADKLDGFDASHFLSAADLPSNLAGYAALTGANFTGDVSFANMQQFKMSGSANTPKIFFSASDLISFDRFNSVFNLRIGSTTANTLYANSTYLGFIGQKVWHAGNDGASSGLDADLLDGQDSSVFAKLASANFTTLKVGGNAVWHVGNDGTGSGLDADQLDGYHATAFARTDTNASFSNLWISATAASLHLNETDAAANQKTWRWTADGGSLVLDCVNDAYNSATYVLTISRSGQTPTGIDIGVPMSTGNITSSGDISATSYDTSSDARLKQGIQPIPSYKSMMFRELKPVEFQFVKSPDKTHAGFIAQDVQKIYPEFVHEDSNKNLTIDTNSLLALAIKKIIQLENEIELLKTRV